MNNADQILILTLEEQSREISKILLQMEKTAKGEALVDHHEGCKHLRLDETPGITDMLHWAEKVSDAGWIIQSTVRGHRMKCSTLGYTRRRDLPQIGLLEEHKIKLCQERLSGEIITTANEIFNFESPRNTYGLQEFFLQAMFILNELVLSLRSSITEFKLLVHGIDERQLTALQPFDRYFN